MCEKASIVGSWFLLRGYNLFLLPFSTSLFHLFYYFGSDIGFTALRLALTDEM